MRVPGGLNCLLRFPLPKKYVRTTPANEYAFGPRYEDDTTESRLHPAYVLSSVYVTVDRPKPIDEILPDFPEISHLCSTGCRVIGLQPSDRSNAPRFVVVPEEATEEQKQAARRAASHLFVNDRPRNPIPAAFFYWERQGICIHFDADSLSWPITSMDFSMVDPSFPEQHTIDWKWLGCKEKQPGTTDLGRFQPK